MCQLMETAIQFIMMEKMKKQRVIFRIFPFNRLTFPVLLNAWEQEGLDKHFDILITEEKPEPVSNDVIFYSFMTPHLPIIYKDRREDYIGLQPK